MNIRELFTRHGISPRGVIHVGAHEGQEVGEYHTIGFEHGLFFEPQPRLFDLLKGKVQHIPHYRALACAVGDRDGTATMFTETANNGLSSSLRKPKFHLEQYPEIVFNGTLEVQTVTLMEVFKTEDISNYNFLNLDVQGFELNVLRGAVAILSSLDAIYSEVSRKELYEGCALIEQIDSFLSTFGFQRKETDWCGDSWGEALYVKGRR